MFAELMEQLKTQCMAQCTAAQEEKEEAQEERAEAQEGKADVDTDLIHFKLPIAFLEQKTILEEHTINDLELSPLRKDVPSLYTYVFNPDTIMGEKTLRLWSNYYTANVPFLKDSQALLEHKLKYSGISAEMQLKVNAIWNEIKGETGFHEKYSYIEWSRLHILNNSSKFLQCLSIYNMASPLFSLFLPIFLLVLPLLILKVRGVPITIQKYIELLKFVFRKHQLGQVFDLSQASFEKIIYILASAVFYVIQVYQNIMSCRRFYYNMSKIHEQIFTMRTYLEATLHNMDILQNQCQGLKTYQPFIETMNSHQRNYEYMLYEFNKVVPNKLSFQKFTQIGHVMKCFYKLYTNEAFIDSLKYSFGFNGYMDNLNGVRKNISAKNISTCTFVTAQEKKEEEEEKKDKKKNKKEKKKDKKDKKEKEEKEEADATFVDAYFPALVNENPVKNTYSLNKHLLITGPNAAGKTTLLKTTIFNIILSQQLGFGFYKKATFTPYDMIHCYINIPDTSARDSLFQAEAKRCKDIIDKIGSGVEKKQHVNLPTMGLAGEAPLRHFCVFDELYSGTNPYEAVSSAYAFLKYLHRNDNVNFVLTTHFLELCRRLEKEKRMNNYHMKIETHADDFNYTYKLEKGISTIKGGIKVLKDLDYPIEIINTTVDTLKELEI